MRKKKALSYHFKDLHWCMHDTIQIDLDVVIQEMDEGTS